MTLKARVVGKGLARRIEPVIPRPPPPSAPQEERDAYNADRREWRDAVSAATTFEGLATQAAAEAEAMMDGASAETETAKQAMLVLQKIDFAREARDQGKVDRAMRWAFEAGAARALMWAIASTGEKARKTRRDRRGANPEHERWLAEAARIWALHPDWGALTVANRVKSTLGATAGVDTIRKRISAKKPGRH